MEEKEKPMRIMILGGTGFIGTVLTRELLMRGHEVVLTSRQPRPAQKKPSGAYAPAHTGDGSETDAYHILREEKGEKGSPVFVPAFASPAFAPAEKAEAMPFVYAAEQESEKASFWSTFGGGHEHHKKHLVRDLVAAASGQALSGSFWKTAEELGAITGQENDAFHLSYAEGAVEPGRHGGYGAGWGQASRAPSYEVWNGVDAKELEPLLGGIDGVVNLIGEYLGGRWNVEKKAALRNSRIRAGRAVAEAVAHRASAGEDVPSVVVQVSAVGYYGTWREFECAPVCAEERPKGKGFLATLAGDWETSSAAVEEVELPPFCASDKEPRGRVRRCVLRLAPVLGEGGFLKHVIPLYKAGFGGVPGSGRQPCAWVHVEDVARAMAFVLEHGETGGVYNVCASPDDTMRGLSEALGWALHKPVWLPMPEVTLRLTMGEVADELILTGQRVSSQRLLDAGFRFRYATLDEAVLHVVSGKRD